ncbi:Protein of unknown function [Novosphingobium sp. CF614]|uniref:DUF2975 domain-containing protein n=1 Tax=Novosphingobium sp. CF614 TaxID=1884364 RepID=UPI0008E502B4|nr:DUF2975 domain-containing protein [Novosphingobium sp. CF614]SFF79465.1 Protein of unknown function [Novosphingobium sp. CF614]
MSRLSTDPLLAVAKGLLYFLMGVMVLAAAACTIALPVILFMREKVTVELASAMPSTPTAPLVAALCGVLLLAIALLATVFLILLLLKRIVDTVGEGDPFVPDNALRLTRMAWLSLVVQLVAIPLTGIGMWLDRVSDGHSGEVQVDGGLSGNGLLLMLILFILARVFRKGAEMRAELEGTV